MNILIADDDQSCRRGMSVFLEQHGHSVIQADNGEVALSHIIEQSFDLVISDVKMPRLSGLELLNELSRQRIAVPVIIMTAFANVKDAVQALKNGAKDYLTKPLNLEELLLKISRLQENQKLIAENASLKSRLRHYEQPDMVGESPALLRVKELITRVGRDGDVPVVIYGESGTGKELAARMIHLSSPRRENAFVAINCAALNDELLESELFGHVKGAYTGAIRDKSGLFKTAHQGSLFLDEIAETSPRMQAKLLRAVQEGVVQPVGSDKQETVDVRIICASNKKLSQLVSSGDFREDLYFRLNIFDIEIPPLRERAQDIPLLLNYFIQKHSSGSALKILPDALASLTRYSWPGNIRELENLVRKLVVLYPDQPISPKMLPDMVAPAQTTEYEGQFKPALEQVVSEFEQRYFSRLMEKSGGNVSKAAEAAGLSRVALYQKLKKYDLHS